MQFKIMRIRSCLCCFCVWKYQYFDKKAGLIMRHWNNRNNHADLNLVLPIILNNFAKQLNRGGTGSCEMHSSLCRPQLSPEQIMWIRGFRLGSPRLHPCSFYVPWISLESQNNATRFQSEWPVSLSCLMSPDCSVHWQKNTPREVENPFKSHMAVCISVVLIRC